MQAAARVLVEHGLSLAERQAIALRLWKEEIQRAREDVNIFVELCARNDQEAGFPAFEQQWFHREWQHAWCTQRRVVFHGATGFGKTEQAIFHLLWRMGRNPAIRILLVGKQQENAKRLLRKIRRQIEGNPMVRAVFPELVPGLPWTDDRLRLAGAGLDTTTDTVETYGLDSSPQGARADIVLADDIVDFENSLTEYQRKKLIAFIDQAIRTRLTTNGQFFMLANAWHEEDVTFDYSRRAGVWYRAYPAVNDTGQLLWPSFRSQAWLDSERESMPLASFERMYLCKPRSDATRIFQSKWFADARKRGASVRPQRAVAHAFDREGSLLDPAKLHLVGVLMAQRLRVVIGVDLATGKTEKKRKSDFTVFFVLGIHPDGSRQVLWIEKGRWSVDVSLERLKLLEQRYRPEMFVVEDNGAQVFLAQFARAGGFETPIMDFSTGAEKWHESLGIEGIGVEMRTGRWIIPAPAANDNEADYRARLAPDELESYLAICDWSSHLLDFSRVGHTPDDVMAGYFAKQGALAIAGATFAHSHAAAAPPGPLATEHQQSQALGTWGTAMALFQPQASAPAPEAAPAPEPTAPPAFLSPPAPASPPAALAKPAAPPAPAAPSPVSDRVRNLFFRGLSNAA